MHLAFEAVGVKYGGGAVVLVDILSAACRNAAVSQVTVLCSPRAARRFELPQSEKLQVLEQDAAERTVTGRMLWLLRGQCTAVRALRPDVFISLVGVGLGKPAAFKAVMVQQSLPFCTEALARYDAATRVRMAVIRSLTGASCRNADMVFAQTPTMAQWISDGYRVSPERISVVLPWVDCIGLGEEQHGSVAHMADTPADRRLLYVGDTGSHKNLECIVNAMPGIRRRIPGATAFLTCSPNHPICRNEGIVGLGYLGGESLKAAYQMATAFVTPSLVESGNLVLVEAMTLGTPVLAADRPYARDLCGDAAVYFDPNQPAALAATAIELLQNLGQRQERARQGFKAVARGRQLRPSDRMIERIVSQACQ